MATRLKVPSSLQTRAAIEPGTYDPEKGTVDLTWTTGARGKRQGWSGPFFEELEVSPEACDLSRLNNGASVLDTHGQWALSSILGVVTRAWIEGGKGHATIRFSDRPEVAPVKADVQAGIIRHVSVGYQVGKYQKVGEVEDVPVYRAVRWTPAELSFVPVAFDDGAMVRSSETQRPQDFTEVELDSTTTEEHRMEPTAAAPATPAAAAAAPASVTQPASDEATRAATEAATRAERERASGIRLAVRAARLDGALADKLVSEGVALDKARAMVLDQLAARSEATETTQHTIETVPGGDEREKFQRGVGAALLARAGLADTIREASKNPKVADAFKDVSTDPGEFRGMTLLELARASLERAGCSTKGLSKIDLVGRAFTYRGVTGPNTTSDFGSILENLLHKTLLANYAITPDTWTQFCATRPASDFRAQNFYRNGTFGVLDSLNEAGEFKNKGIPDAEKHAFSIGTKGNIIAISRQSIINDDMGAFTDLASRLGRAAKLSIEVDVYALLAMNSGMGPNQADGNALFHTAHANVNGTGSAIGSSGLDADRVVLASQKDPSGNEILDLRPAILVLPVALGGQARVINESRFDVDTAGGGFTNSTATKFMLPNRVGGLFRSVVDSPRLTGTRRYLFADPAVAPVLVVAFLDGQQLPYLESDLGWRVDGTEWKIRLDYGVGAIDWRGAVTNAGA